MTSASSVPIERKQLESQTIFVGNDGATSIVRCQLKDCHVIVDTTEATGGIYESELRHCTIEFKRTLKNTPIFSNDFYNCAFIGRFKGVDFGRSPWPNPLTHRPEERGELVDCDFKEATLDMCRLFDVNVSRQKFALLPQFVVPYRKEVFASLAKRKWPGKFAIYLLMLRDEPPALSACTGTMSDFIKKYQVSEGELRQALQDIGAMIG